MRYDEYGDVINHANAGMKPMFLGLPAYTVVPYLLMFFHPHSETFQLLVVSTVIFSVLHYKGLRPKEGVRWIKMRAIGWRRQFDSRRKLQRNFARLRQ